MNIKSKCCNSVDFTVQLFIYSTWNRRKNSALQMLNNCLYKGTDDQGRWGSRPLLPHRGWALGVGCGQIQGGGWQPTAADQGCQISPRDHDQPATQLEYIQVLRLHWSHRKLQQRMTGRIETWSLPQLCRLPTLFKFELFIDQTVQCTNCSFFLVAALGYNSI